MDSLPLPASIHNGSPLIFSLQEPLSEKMQTSQDELLTASEKAPSSLLLPPRWQGKARRPAGRGRSQLAESRGARQGRRAAFASLGPKVVEK